MVDPKHIHLKRRAAMIAAIRGFFTANGYLEVETPLRLPLPLPEAHIELFDSEGWVLQPSPETCMKRLLAAGHPKIFQICKCFRKAERGRRHLPEMTLLEWYAAGDTYTDLMVCCEALLPRIACELGSGAILPYQGRRIDLTPPWQRLTVREAFDRFAAMPLEAALAQGRFDEMMGLMIEPNLGLERPVFLTDYPAEHASLARLAAEDPAVAERFELYVGGLELCNGFSELNDPAEQRRRFAAEQERMQAAGKRVRPLPETFLAALAHMPAGAGNALGIDRLAMLFCDAAAIDTVVAFVPEQL
ncbi:MAG: EF-P lysine aminoacylase EpmA [Desulfobacterales bacterium]|jgi:lysyl-tRNA synthetase class 2|nr:EF-P lysine aminoacylase EpmA [Desulfobacterales bacterium]